MEHLVAAEQAGRVVGCRRPQVGATVHPGQPLVTLDLSGTSARHRRPKSRERRRHGERGDLAEVVAAHAVGSDEQRPEAVERRRLEGQRTARENVADLVDDGTFVEYGPLAVAAQRRRREPRRPGPAPRPTAWSAGSGASTAARRS